MKYLLFALLVACSSSKKDNETSKGHNRLYSSPKEESVESLPMTSKRLVIVATNDWQGALEARQEKAEDTFSPEKTLVSVGGSEILSRYLQILRNKYPEQVLLVDAGNSIGKSKISKSSGGQAIFEAFDKLQYDAITLSGTDLAAGPKLKRSVSPQDWLPAILGKTKTPVLLSNLIDLKTTMPIEWVQTLPHLIKEVNGVKVGIMGLLADSVPKTVGVSALNGFYIEPAEQTVLKQARHLRLKGAEVVVLLMYGGLDCSTKRSKEKNLPVSKVNFDPNDPTLCDSDSEMARFLSLISPETVDVVVTGGAPGKTANLYSGIPVIQAFGKGSSFSRIDIVWDSTLKKVDKAQTVFHQPTRLCQRFFKSSEDCYVEDTSVDHRHLVPATYLGEPVYPESVAREWMNGWREFIAIQKITQDQVKFRASGRAPALPHTQP